jgi:hypothetical protein
VILATPQPFAEAVQKLGSRTPIARSLSSSQWADVPVDLRERAFLSAHIEDIRFLDRVQTALFDFLTGARETLPDGSTALRVGSRAQFVELMRRAAIEEGIPVPPEWRGTIRDVTAESRLNLIFDVQTKAAQSYGAWRQAMDPAVLNEFPADRFIREIDVAQPRPVHIQNTGVVRLKTDLSFWVTMNSPSFGGFGVPWGPWGFNSGMGVEDVDRDEAESLGLLKPGDRLQPVEQQFNEGLKASTRNISPELRAWLRDKLGDQAVFDGDDVRWASGAPAVVTPAPAVPAIPDWSSEMANLVRELEVEGLAHQAVTERAHALFEVPTPLRQSISIDLRTRNTDVLGIVRRGADHVSQFVHPELIRPVSIAAAALRPGGRAFYSPALREINISPDNTAAIAAHEILHGIEHQNPDVLRATAAFLLRRAPGEQPQTLRQLTGFSYYPATEIALEDDWKRRGGTHYAGRLYSKNGKPEAESILATEILTTGFERFLDDPVGFYRDDPDWFTFLIRTLRRP